MFLPDLKLELKKPSLDPSSGSTMAINRLYLSDRTSQPKYLIDIKADVSVIPLTTTSKHLPSLLSNISQQMRLSSQPTVSNL
ncbi:hypothetical protein TNCV_990971 [Trichonephila clavipes]|nr:hypothetical protein TNCV_990971 [Trichonephila clavipes]